LRFEEGDIEAIMVTKRKMRDAKEFLAKHEMDHVSVVTYEMLLKV